MDFVEIFSIYLTFLFNDNELFFYLIIIPIDVFVIELYPLMKAKKAVHCNQCVRRVRPVGHVVDLEHH